MARTGCAIEGCKYLDISAYFQITWAMVLMQTNTTDLYKTGCNVNVFSSKSACFFPLTGSDYYYTFLTTFQVVYH